jgi:hypothetical protein
VSYSMRAVLHLYLGGGGVCGGRVRLVLYRRWVVVRDSVRAGQGHCGAQDR